MTAQGWEMCIRYSGYTDKKDADFIEELRVRTAETRQDTRSAILNVLSESCLLYTSCARAARQSWTS